jgi:hypothetical protein
VTDWLWLLWKAAPYGLAAVCVVAVGPARMMVWVGVRVEVAGRSLVQAGVDYQRRKDARRDRIIARMAELKPNVEPTREEARA